MFWGTDITRMLAPGAMRDLFTEELPWLKAATLELGWAKPCATGSAGRFGCGN